MVRKKNENVFKFKKFQDRIQEVDLRKSAFYYLEHSNEKLQEDTSYFHQNLQKWSVLNLTEEYSKFQNRVKNIITLPQLIHQKEFVVNHLLGCLDEATTLSLQPLLETIVVLAKDLREDFYSHFPEFLERLIRLLDTQDADQTEWILICLAFLFKTLKPFLRKDLSNIVPQIIPLLNEETQPAHVINFAVECFSFVARDIKDRDKFILMMLHFAKKDENYVMGCGKLFFEMLKGFNGQLHSTAETFLTALFEGFTRIEFKSYFQVLYEILVQTLGELLEFLETKNFAIVWKIMFSTIENVLEVRKENLNFLLKLMGQALEYRNGKKLQELEKIINIVIKIIDCEDLSEDDLLSTSQIGALLLSHPLGITQLDASRLSKKILSISHQIVFENFVLNSIDYSQFEILILPDFLKYFEYNFCTSTLKILVKIVNRNDVSFYLKNPETIKKIKKITLDFDVEEFSGKVEFILVLQLLAHIKGFAEKEVLVHLKNQIERILESDPSKFQFYLLSLIARKLHQLEPLESALQLKIIEVILEFSSQVEYQPLLELLDFLLENLKKQELTEKLFEKIHEKLSDNLMCEFQKTRLLTARILARFDYLQLAPINEPDSEISIYTIFQRIEEIHSNVQNYRDQILQLQKLDWDSSYFQLLKENRYKADALKYCLGFLFVNFQLLWEPIRDVIQSYAVEFDTNEFWSIFKKQLDYSVEKCRTSLKSQEVSEIEEELNEEYQEFWENPEKIDYIKYRISLLKTIAEFRNYLYNDKNRDLVILFLDFLANEFEYESSEDDADDKETPKARQKLLIAHLQVFAKITCHRNMFKEKECYKKYRKFLLHRNFQVQKLALDCLMQYKEPFLVNYKDLLTKLLDEKSFKNELVSLDLNTKILDDHRKDFMEVFLAILYTKLTVKVVKKDNEGFKQKKETIVRFLSNLQEQEIFKLTEISVDYLETCLSAGSYAEMLETAEKLSGIKASQLQSTLNFIDMIKRNVAGLFSAEYQRYLLKVLLCISCFTKSPQTAIMKNLRQSCLASIIGFLEQFDQHNWEDQEVNLLFSLFVDQQLETFAQDNSQNVTGLMKLFVEFSKNPRYFVFLARKSSDQENYPLKSIVQLLEFRSTTKVVIECVMDLVERLLTLRTDQSLIIQNILEIDETSSLNYGTQLLKPFVREILLKIKDYLNQKRNKILSKRNLLILSRITELVSSKDTTVLLDILFPLTLKKSWEDGAENDDILKLFTTILNLLSCMESPLNYLRHLAPLFECVHEVNLRKFLLKMFNQIYGGNDEVLTEIINGFGAYDKRWIEQPDHEKRLSVFRKLDVLMESNELTVDRAVFVLYHCFHYLRFEKDLAIRDNASHYLKLVAINMISNIKDDKKALDYFVDKVILNLLQRGINDSSKIQTEAILWLGELARKCSDVHPVFKDLHPLTNQKVRDLDFFDNITHLQKFRHMKGLRRFNEVAKTLEKPPNTRTLVEFLIPISRIFICAEEYRKKSKIIEAAVDFVAAICRFLPWNHYESLLKFYMRKMGSDSVYQKQLIKLIPAILDSFHFDLSSVEEKEIKMVVESVAEEEQEQDQDNESVGEPEEEEEVTASVSTKLKPSMVKRIITALSRRLIPSLFKIVNEQISFDKAHKLNKEDRRAKEKSDMLRIPIALPIVKLLQKLPAKFLEDNLSQVLYKVCSFLKSTLKQVRATARMTLNEIVGCLGTGYLEQVLSHLNSLLSKGFQVHVLSVTTHSLLDRMKKELKAGDVDKIMQMVMNVTLDDIFKKFSDTENIGIVARRTPEAKPSRKSFLTLNILAANIGENSILDLLLPFKEQLTETQSKKTCNKIQECLNKIVAGLTVNPHISIESLMILSYGTISESIPDLLPNQKNKLSKEEKERLKRLPVDSYLIPPEPKRRGATTVNKAVRTNKQTNSHILTEFGLELMSILLKRKKIFQIDCVPYLDPMIPPIVDCLKSNFVRVNMLAIKCITLVWNNKIELSGMKERIEEIVKLVFGVLHKYSTSGVSRKDNNFLLVKNSFKCVIGLLKHVDYYKITDDQLKTLLLYVEQDLYNHDRETMVFVLLKSIIERKLKSHEIGEVMKKIFEISVTAELKSTQEACRQISLLYLMEYPIEKKLDSHIKFFIAQMNYDVISGRESAIQMMILMFKNFPKIMLHRYSGLFFLALGTRLVNDDSAECKKLIAEGIETLLKKIDNNPRQQAFDIIISMLRDEKLVHREMAAQLCIRFVNAEESSFIQRIPVVLPELVKSLTNTDDDVGKFVKLKKPKLELEINEQEEEENTKVRDHHLIQTMNAIIKIFEVFEEEVFTEKYKPEVSEVAFQAQFLLAHDHLWVRLGAMKLINFILKNQDMSKLLEDGDQLKQMKSLTFDMCVQLKPEIDQELLLQIMNNLLYIANLLKELPIGDVFNDKKDFNLLWLVRRLRYAVHAEIAQTPTEIILRKQIFQFFEALVALLDNEILLKLANSLLSPVIREMVDGEHVIEDLKVLATHVGDQIKKRIGLEEFDKVRLELQSRMLRKRVDRRKTLAQEKINYPEKAAERKIIKQLKKQDNRKRKRRDMQDGIILPRKKKFSFKMDVNELF